MTVDGLPGITAASVIIGFISFAFTLATFVRVIWGNLQTIWHAPSQIGDSLGSLKQSLYEERTHIRLIRRRCRGDYDEGPFRVLNDTLRHMIRDFKAIEEPFLVHPTPPQSSSKGRSSRSYSHDYHGNGVGPPPAVLRRRSGVDEDQYEPDDYYNTQYKKVSLRMRWLWLRKRDSIVDLSQKLQVVQTRRMARQMTTMQAELKYVSMTVMDLEDRAGRDGGRPGRGVRLRDRDREG